MLSSIRSAALWLSLLGGFASCRAYGQTTDAEDTDPHPLKMAETSSPRAVFRGFLADADTMFAEWKKHRGQSTLASIRAQTRAISVLDFSATPDGDSLSVRLHRVLMLWEILKRIPLLADDQIPGLQEVQDGLSAWTVPTTPLVIERDEQHGARGFVFSQDSVERIDRYYRKIKHLPTQDGFEQKGYENFILSDHAPDLLIRERLRPIDRSSPRSTLSGFLESVNNAYKIVQETDAALRADPPKLTYEQTQTQEALAQKWMERAMATLDLSEVPEATRADVGLETALQLKEVLDRTHLPPIDAVPNAHTVAIEKKRRDEFRNTAPIQWRYPNTTIMIVEMSEGDERGSFRFSSATVDKISTFRKSIEDLPYLESDRRLNQDYISPQVSPGFYQQYISTPGSLISRSTRLGHWVDKLPAWCKNIYFGQTIWQWVLGAVAMLLALLAVVLISFAFYRWGRSLRSPWSHWGKIAVLLAVVQITRWTVVFLDQSVNFTGSILSFTTTGESLIVILLLAYAVFSFCSAIVETVIASPRISNTGIDASFMRLGGSLAGVLLGAWIIIRGLHNVGIDMVPLLAGLGVGGLAVALAARPTLENLIGGFLIFWLKPFRVGERVEVLGYNGWVEEIGAQNTTIRQENGHLTSIPNQKMAFADIENIDRRPHIQRTFDVNLPYETPAPMIRRALEIIREILALPELAEGETHPNQAIHHPDFPPRVFFDRLDPNSLRILVIYWRHPASRWEFLEHATWVNVQIMERFDAEGIGFASSQPLELMNEGLNEALKTFSDNSNNATSD